MAGVAVEVAVVVDGNGDDAVGWGGVAVVVGKGGGKWQLSGPCA